MNPTFTAIPVADFHVVALAAARRTIEELLPACLRPVYVDEGESLAVRLQGRINALRAKYEYTLSNRLLKAFDDAERTHAQGDGAGREALTAIQAIAGADPDVPAQVGVSIAARQVSAALRRLRERGEFAGVVDVARISHHIFEVHQVFDEALGQALQAWLQKTHPGLAGQGWTICTLELSCPVVVVSARPREMLVDVEDLKPQWMQLLKRAEVPAINRAIGVVLAEIAQSPDPTGE